MLDELTVMKDTLKASRARNAIDFILPVPDFGPDLLRVKYKDNWYVIVDKTYFETIRPEPISASAMPSRWHDGLIIPAGALTSIPVIEDEALVKEILECIDLETYVVKSKYGPCCNWEKFNA